MANDSFSRFDFFHFYENVNVEVTFQQTCCCMQFAVLFRKATANCDEYKWHLSNRKWQKLYAYDPASLEAQSEGNTGADILSVWCGARFRSPVCRSPELPVRT